MSGSADGTAKIWSPKSGQSLITLVGHTSAVVSIALLANGQIATGSQDRSIKIWNAQTGQMVRTLSGHDDTVQSLTVLKNGYLASGSLDWSVKIWNTNTGQAVKSIYFNGPVTSVLQLLDGNLAVASGGLGDAQIVVLNWETEEIVRTLVSHLDRINALSQNRDGNLTSVSNDKSIKVWSMWTGRLLLTLNFHTAPVNAATALYNVNANLATGSDDSSIRIWNTDAGFTSPLIKTLQDQFTSIRSLTQLENGNLVSASDDGVIKMWNIASGQVLMRFSEHKGRVLTLTHFSSS